jgi:hypothetical protein
MKMSPAEGIRSPAVLTVHRILGIARATRGPRIKVSPDLPRPRPLHAEEPEGLTRPPSSAAAQGDDDLDVPGREQSSRPAAASRTPLDPPPSLLKRSIVLLAADAR